MKGIEIEVAIFRGAERSRREIPVAFGNAAPSLVSGGRALCAAAAFVLHVALVSLWFAAHALPPRTANTSGDGASPTVLTVRLLESASSSELLRTARPREIVLYNPASELELGLAL